MPSIKRSRIGTLGMTTTAYAVEELLPEIWLMSYRKRSQHSITIRSPRSIPPFICSIMTAKRHLNSNLRFRQGYWMHLRRKAHRSIHCCQHSVSNRRPSWSTALPRSRKLQLYSRKQNRSSQNTLKI